VLIIGEFGTETELVARCLHDFSRREAKTFVALNCGGLSEAILDGELFGSELGAAGGARSRRLGKLECAGNGTLFLDGIEAMPAAIQAKLLGVLQDRGIRRRDRDDVIPISPRIIAAIGAGPDAEGAVSSDLRDRLGAAQIELAPLRDRREDIPALYDKCLGAAAKRYGRPEPLMSADEYRRLLAYDWPGNIGEMRNHADCQLLGIARDAGAVQASQQAGLTLT
jgi:DNA-binding NtrC family response regulator